MPGSDLIRVAFACGTPEANRAKSTVQVKVQVENPNEHLRPEMNARVNFLSDKAAATDSKSIARVLVPASLSGIISAVLLGLGRVIGETMVVLLCAGNRIAIPDFTQGLGAFFQPVHTMTGIIAQEMGEVVRGSIHYRALFMVGLVLFALTLGINYLAQRLVARYRMSIG